MLVLKTWHLQTIPCVEFAWFESLNWCCRCCTLFLICSFVVQIIWFDDEL